MGDKPARELFRQKIAALEEEISKRREAEKSLRDCEEKARAMVNAITGIAVLIDSEGHILAANENAPRQFGLPMDEFIGRNAFDLFPPDEAKPRKAAVERAKRTGKPARIEVEKDGRHFESHIYPIQGPQEKVVRLSLFITETTEQKQVEEALRESEEKFRTIAEQSPNMVFINKGGRIVYVNQRSEELMGYSREEFCSPTFDFFCFIAPDSRKLAAQSLKRHATGKEVGPLEYELVTKNGRMIDALITTKLIHFEGSLSILGIVTDISARKAAEKALRESEMKHKTLIRNIPGFVYRARPDWTAEIMSSSEEICGYTVEELEAKEKNWLSIVHPEDQDLVFMEGSELAKKQKHLVQTYRILAKDGQTRWVEDRKTSLFSEEGELIGIEGILQDVTDRIEAEKNRKKLERKLRQALKMEAIGTMAGGIAHDFNNILAAITGYSELALLHAPGESRVKVNLENVLKCCDRAKNLIQQILAFSRQKDPVQRLLDVTPLFKESMRLIRSSLPATISIHQTIGKNIGAVKADPTQLQQVLMNLCTNAGQAMQEAGGVLDVTLEEVQLDEKAASDHVHLEAGPHLKLSVSDTGIGIDPENKEKIFDPYFTTRDEEGGTGMGLAMVHGIVKNHHGEITVRSEPGKGSTFTVLLPVAGKKPGQKQKTRPETLPRGRERILFVDDEVSLVEIGRQMLEHLGYEVDAYSSSKDIPDLFRKDPELFDLVITDTAMPGIPGDKLAEALLEVRPDIPIILCTGYSERMSPEKAEKIGIKAFVMKPLVMQELAETVRNVLDQQGS
jgi:PAS domain S-box-containing protein